MKNTVVSKNFWRDKKVLVTGHTGFKGSWLCLWLSSMGAKVTGYALKPSTNPSLYECAEVANDIESVVGDIRDMDKLSETLKESGAELVIHLAAQPLVRYSYTNPVETYEVNVMGTVNLLEAVRKNGNVKAVVNVTTDKCYENKEWHWGYREYEPMGGYDPYSNSKSCSELVTASYRNSFFSNSGDNQKLAAIASARAGNVIGGGDWADDRLIPDILRSIEKGVPVSIRSPHAVRPWQHVLEPLGGYLMLAEALYTDGSSYAEGWNFGPNDDDAKEVLWIVNKLCNLWGGNAAYVLDSGAHPHEATFLKLDISKAGARLGWRPVWDLEYTLEKIVEFGKSYNKDNMCRQICLDQINEYISAQQMKDY